MFFARDTVRAGGHILLAGAILAPLGVWKLVEIVIWLLARVRVVLL